MKNRENIWEAIIVSFFAFALALTAMLSFIGGWFIWEWTPYIKIMMTIFDIGILIFSAFLIWLAWSK